MIKRLLLCLLLFAAFLSACQGVGDYTVGVLGAPVEARQRLTVFAAASLTEAFTAIGAQFEAAHPNVQVVFNYAGSQQLAYQLAQGAPADVYASGNQRQMQAVVQSGRASAREVRIFAHNRLVVVFPADNPAGIRELEDLTKPGLKLGLATEAAPVGYYSLQFLDNASQPAALGTRYKQNVLGNVVSYEENVRAVLGKVLLGEVDGGIVFASDISPANAAQLGRLDIPDGLNVLASYYIVPVGDSDQPEIAAAFLAFVLSPQGQTILVQHGFMPRAAGLMEAAQ
jgi:molybdate transport system substrate-binding protein